MVASNRLARKLTKIEDARFWREELLLHKDWHGYAIRERQQRKIMAVTGISDQHLIDRMLSAGLEVDSLPALDLAPIAIVAWASGSCCASERAAAIAAIMASSARDNVAAIELFESWLSKRPDSSLLDLWSEYMPYRLSQMTRSQQEIYCLWLANAAKSVAAAAGGYAGIDRICESERRVIDRMEGEFRKTGVLHNVS